MEARFAHQQNGTQSEHVERVAFEFRSGVGVEPRVAGLRASGVAHEHKDDLRNPAMAARYAVTASAEFCWRWVIGPSGPLLGRAGMDRYARSSCSASASFPAPPAR